jgi:hypothetical protein
MTDPLSAAARHLRTAALRADDPPDAVLLAAFAAARRGGVRRPGDPAPNDSALTPVIPEGS